MTRFEVTNLRIASRRGDYAVECQWPATLTARESKNRVQCETRPLTP